jgi:hypothetical protein
MKQTLSIADFKGTKNDGSARKRRDVYEDREGAITKDHRLHVRAAASQF